MANWNQRPLTRFDHFVGTFFALLAFLYFGLSRIVLAVCKAALIALLYSLAALLIISGAGLAVICILISFFVLMIDPKYGMDLDNPQSDKRFHG